MKKQQRRLFFCLLPAACTQVVAADSRCGVEYGGRGIADAGTCRPRTPGSETDGRTAAPAVKSKLGAGPALTLPLPLVPPPASLTSLCKAPPPEQGQSRSLRERDTPPPLIALGQRGR